MSFSFGSTTNQGSAFGSAAKPSFSFGSTNTATTSTAGFGGFGTTTTSSGFGAFGAPATSSAAPFGTLGTAPASTTPSLFGSTAFSSTTAKPTAGFGGFGAGAFGTGSTFGTGTSTFGTAAPTFGATTQASSTFGTGTFGTGSAFGSTFGAKTAPTAFGGFGTTTFGQQPQQQQQQQLQQQQGPTTAQEALVAAIYNCSVFGDERDQVLAKWNLLQAQWGTGQAYYNRNAPALELNEQNPQCRFKAVGYSRLGGREDKDGHVALLFNKGDQEIKNNQQVLITSLSGLLGNKPNLTVNIESIKAASENKSQVVIYVLDKGAAGALAGAAGTTGTPVSATELAAFLNAGAARSALAGAGCSSVVPVTRPTAQMLAQYLQTPPPGMYGMETTGMDIRLWKQAQADNPDPDNYIPVPIIGFSEIAFRWRCQSEEAALQASWLRRAAESLGELRTRRAASAATLAQLGARLHALRHALLQAVSRREVCARRGAALAPAEEAARARLHALAAQLAAPPLHNGRLNELLCAVRLQRSASAGATHERYHLDPEAQEDVKQFLSLQQRGMAHLMDTAKKDLSALNIIADGMSRLVRT